MPALFFLLVFLLGIPFWLMGAGAAWQPLPGLPVAAFMFVCPFVAALPVVFRESGAPGVRRLLARAIDPAGLRRPIWVAAALLVVPAALVLAYGVMRLLGIPLPDARLDLRPVPLLFAAFVVSALIEQIGWSGYAYDALRARSAAVSASVWVGAVWAAWHVVPLLQAGRTAQWIAGWCLMTVALRVLQSWLYENTDDSLLVAALCQASANTGWQLFPNQGSHYDPRIIGPVLAGVGAFVVLAYGSGLRKRNA